MATIFNLQGYVFDSAGTISGNQTIFTNSDSRAYRAGITTGTGTPTGLTGTPTIVDMGAVDGSTHLWFWFMGPNSSINFNITHAGGYLTFKSVEINAL